MASPFSVQPAHSISDRFRRRARIVTGLTVVGILVVGATLRIPGIRDTPFWTDEHYTHAIASSGPLEIVRHRWTAHPPGYPLAAHLALALDAEPWMARLPALVGGLLGILVLHRGLCILGWKRLATPAAFLLALSVYHVYFSQEARGYTWMAALSACAVFLAIRHVERPSTGCLAGSILASACACGFHYLAAPTCLAVLLCAFAADVRRYATTRTGERGATRPAAIFAPWLLVPGLALAALCLSWGRIPGIVEMIARPAAGRVEPSARFLANVLARWSGMGLESGWLVLAVSALGLGTALRQSLPRGLILGLAAGSPLLVPAILPWPQFFESRYLMAGLIPSLTLFCLGLDWLARLLVRRLSRRRAPSLAMELAALGLVFAPVFAAQFRATWEHWRHPRKYTPARTTTEFGYRNIVFHSYLDPWMMRSASADEIPVVRRDFAGLTWLVPDWPVASMESKPGGRFIAQLVNGADEETLTIVVVPLLDKLFQAADSSMGPVIEVQRSRISENAARIRYVNRMTGGPVAEARIVGVDAERGRKFMLTVQSTRVEAVDAYLRDAFGRVQPGRPGEWWSATAAATDEEGWSWKEGASPSRASD